MGDLIRGHDWSRTPLGALGSWPPFLRGAVSLVLASGYPAVLLWGPDHLVAAYNEAYRRVLGDKGEVLGRPFAEVWSEVRHILDGQLVKAWAGETVTYPDARFLLRRGGAAEEAWFRYTLAPLGDETGAVAGLLCTGVEITEARLRERELRANEAAFRTFANLVPDLLWSHDSRGETNWFNQRWLDYTGQTPEQVAGFGWADALHPDDRAESMRVAQESLAAGKAFVHQHRLRSREGVYRWFLVRAEPVGDPETGELRWYGAATDVDEQRAVLDALAASEESLRLALDVGGLAAWDWNLETGVITWSDEHFRMLGHEVGDIVPSYRAWAEQVHPDDLAGAEAAIAAARDTRRDFVHQFRLVKPDGAVAWISARARFFYEGARAVRMVGVMEDVTDQRRWQETQRLLLSELQHRTRNQLAVIRSIVTRTAEASGDLDDFLSHFEGRLGAFARTQAALTRSAQVSVHLESLIADEFLAAASADQADLEGPDVNLVGKAAESVSLAIHELVTNAVKYGALSVPAGRVRVAWRLDPQGDLLVIDWRESGVPLLDTAPPRRGFGRRLIEEAMPYELGAVARLDFAPGGLRAHLEVPMNSASDQ